MTKTTAIRNAAKKIELVILDVDGVLTDGSIILDNDGNEYKAFYVRDGHGIRMLIKSGIRVVIITGRYSKVVERRAAELGITEVYQKCYDKRVAYDKLLQKHALAESAVAYVGDDIVDIPVMRRVGFPVAVADAADEVKEIACMVTKRRGGRGAVREVSDLILKARGLWRALFNEYLKT